MTFKSDFTTDLANLKVTLEALEKFREETGIETRLR